LIVASDTEACVDPVSSAAGPGPVPLALGTFGENGSDILLTF
jgi:hypothetical protein